MSVYGQQKDTGTVAIISLLELLELNGLALTVKSVSYYLCAFLAGVLNIML